MARINQAAEIIKQARPYENTHHEVSRALARCSPQSGIGYKTCDSLRRACRRYSRETVHKAWDGEFTPRNIQTHVEGECECEGTVPPVSVELGWEVVDADECAHIQSIVKSCRSIRQASRRTGWSKWTIIRHMRGDCQHGDGTDPVPAGHEKSGGDGN